MNNYKQIYKIIKKYNTIVIARHIGADPDALGSQFGLKNLIARLFPTSIPLKSTLYTPFTLLISSSSINST